MRNIKFVIPCEESVDHIIENMREIDRYEIEALGGDVADSIRYGAEKSDPCAVMTVNSQPACIFGVLGDEHTAVVWMVGTDLMDECKHQFVKRSRAIIKAMQDRFPLMSNLVSARNTKSIKWLKSVGFRVLKARNIGVNGEPFHVILLRGKT